MVMWHPCKPSPSSQRWRWFVGFVDTLPVMKPSREPLLTSTGANIKLTNHYLCLINQNLILTMITRGSLFLEPIHQDGRLWHGKTRNGIFQWGLQGYTQGEHLLVWPFINIENSDKSNPDNKKWYSHQNPCSGDRKSDGAEDEQASFKQNEHAKGDPAYEQAETSQHSEVSVSSWKLSD